MDVGLIGTGLMGLPMAERVLEASFPLIVYNRTADKLDPLREQGVAIAPTPEVLIQGSSHILLMLTNAHAIRQVILSESARPLLAGKTVIQMGTIGPSESRDICNQVIAAGGSYLEAPVLGSIPEAKAGTLQVMVGAEPDQFAACQDLLQCFGQPILVGPVGAAAAVKLALNQLIGSLTTAFATSLGFVLQQNVPVESFMAILRQSALYAPTFDKKLQRMLDRNYANPNFPTKHLMKDINLFLTESEALDLDTSVTVAVSHLLAQSLMMGLAETDYSALFSAVDRPDQ